MLSHDIFCSLSIRVLDQNSTTLFAVKESISPWYISNSYIDFVFFENHSIRIIIRWIENTNLGAEASTNENRDHPTGRETL